jgi:hypothetical protein
VLFYTRNCSNFRQLLVVCVILQSHRRGLVWVRLLSDQSEKSATCCRGIGTFGLGQIAIGSERKVCDMFAAGSGRLGWVRLLSDQSEKSATSCRGIGTFGLGQIAIGSERKVCNKLPRNRDVWVGLDCYRIREKSLQQVAVGSGR